MPQRRWIAAFLVASFATVAAGCGGLGYVVANTPALFGDYERSTNHAYGEDPRQRLDVYSPRRATNRPVVIFWHGGSWTSGRRGLYRFVGAALAVRVEAEFYPGKGHTDTAAALSIPARGRAPVLDHSVRFIESVAAR